MTGRKMFGLRGKQPKSIWFCFCSSFLSTSGPTSSSSVKVKVTQISYIAPILRTAGSLPQRTASESGGFFFFGFFFVFSFGGRVVCLRISLKKQRGVGRRVKERPWLEGMENVARSRKRLSRRIILSNQKLSIVRG